MKLMMKALLTGTALSAAMVNTPIASAATAPVPPAPAGMTQAASSSAATAANGPLGRAFTTSTAERGGKNPNTLLGGDTKATSKPVAVYTLNPAFVKNGTGPVGTFSYAATPYMINGTTATVDSIYKNGAWKAANIATGQDERSYAEQAKGAPLLFEPQVHAWYAINDTTLTALNNSAKKAIGATTITIPEYAKQVHAKYAAYLPGSSYDKTGKAGGFKDAPVSSTSAPVSHSDNTVRAGGLAATAVIASAGGAFALKRRRS